MNERIMHVFWKSMHYTGFYRVNVGYFWRDAGAGRHPLSPTRRAGPDASPFEYSFTVPSPVSSRRQSVSPMVAAQKQKVNGGPLPAPAPGGGKIIRACVLCGAGCRMLPCYQHLTPTLTCAVRNTNMKVLH